MRYLPTIDVWDAAVDAALRGGQLRLQRGQWVKCGGGKPSRFVGVRGRTVRAVHPVGNRVSNERFQFACSEW